MSCGYQTLVGGVVDLVVKDYLRSYRRPVDDVDPGPHTVFDGLLPLEIHLYQWGEIPVVEESHVAEVELLAELFTGILEIEHVRPVPHYVHRVHFAKSYVEFL